MNKPIKVSVIVPIYNAEKYLRRCLDSLVNQTLKGIEIICINDGSTDGTWDILNEYRNHYDNIFVIDQSNRGTGFSLNRGIDLADGEYIGTLDSDDWIEADAFEKLYEMAKGCDVVKAGFIHQFEDRMAFRILCDEAFSGIPVNAKFLSRQPQVLSNMLCFQPSVWSGIYRKDFLLDNEIYFNETEGASYQDMTWTFEVFSLAKSVKYTDEVFVHYTMYNPNSSVYRQDKIFCVLYESETIWKFVHSKDELNYLRPYALRFIYGAYMWNLYRLDEKEDKYAFAKEADKYFDFYKSMLSEEDYDVIEKIFGSKEIKGLSLCAKEKNSERSF